ncbi:DUF2341 domain-containing protein [Myxococcota bacterium]|nr:DUF2341 domain-containing protein [Myxococcota bacterium]MBU1381818.1 DUF2341 domain-containing protein [Myxococcota bacterium]MBU1498595.1 DUF2341 domain-containing protein [Myxococcota bacterium]
MKKLLFLFSIISLACSFNTDGPDNNNTNNNNQCGDGTIQTGESCDDNNTQNSDGCNSSCLVEAGWVCVGEPSVCTMSCGNGTIDTGETCDDENTNDNDGCSSNCVVESGWVCTGEPSVCTEGCGNGFVTDSEQCDDFNLDDGDGCSSTCTIEYGYSCTGTPSVCTSTCGDGLIASDEACDDDNTNASDGCTDQCTITNGWYCTGEPSVCTTQCGDGFVTIDEECDDGNTGDNDGCDNNCTVENNYECSGEPSICFITWYDTSYNYRKKLTISGTMILANLADFPVLFTLKGDSEVAAVANEDGSDFVVTGPDGTTLLNSEVQYWDSTEGNLYIWVKMPVLTHQTDSSVYLYYGNPAAVPNSDSGPVWSNNFAGVYHLSENGSGVANEFRDSTSNENHGTSDADRVPTRAVGKWAFAQNFSDSAPVDAIRLGLIDDSQWTGLTVEAWVNGVDTGDDRIFAKTWGNGGDETAWMVGKQGANKMRMRTNTDDITVTAGTAFPTNTWIHMAFTWSPGTITVYRNGVTDAVDTIDGTSLYQNPTDVYPHIGNAPAFDRAFDGLIQEVRVSRVARSSAWLETQFNNLDDPSSFITVGLQEEHP